MSGTDEKIGEQAVVMRGQLDEMRADQRPWIKIAKIEPYSMPNSPFNGLIYFKETSHAILNVRLELTNVGRSPAFNIGAHVTTKFFRDDPNFAETQQSRCEALDNVIPKSPMLVDNTDFIPIIFPNDVRTYDGVAAVFKVDDAKEAAETSGLFTFWIYGCVRYHFGGSPHQTSFAYRVMHLIDATVIGGKAASAFKLWENVPASEIMFWDRPMATGITN